MKMSALPLTCLLFVTAAVAQQPGARLLVLSKTDHTIAIVDPATQKVLARAPVGEDPHEVIASSDGRTAYVSNYGFGSLHTLTVIDLVNDRRTGVIDLGALSGPHGLTFVGGKVWFTAEGAKAIGRWDPAANRVDWVMGTGQDRTHMIYVAPDEQSFVTTNVSSGTVTFGELQEVHMPPPPPQQPGKPAGGPPPGMQHRKDWHETVVKVGSGSEGFDLSPDGKEMWVANAQDGTISVIDRASKTVTATLQSNTRGANRLKFTPDGSQVLVSLLGGGGIVVLDARTRTFTKTIPTAHGCAGIQMQPDGSRAYVSCGLVQVVDLKTMTVTGQIDAGGEPDGLAWASGQ